MHFTREVKADCTCWARSWPSFWPCSVELSTEAAGSLLTGRDLINWSRRPALCWEARDRRTIASLLSSYRHTHTRTKSHFKLQSHYPNMHFLHFSVQWCEHLELLFYLYFLYYFLLFYLKVSMFAITFAAVGLIEDYLVYIQNCAAFICVVSEDLCHPLSFILQVRVSPYCTLSPLSFLQCNLIWNSREIK